MKEDIMINRLNTEIIRARETERDYELDRNHWFENLKEAIEEYESGYRSTESACERIERFACEMNEAERYRKETHMEVEKLNWIAMKGMDEE